MDRIHRMDGCGTIQKNIFLVEKGESQKRINVSLDSTTHTHAIAVAIIVTPAYDPNGKKSPSKNEHEHTQKNTNVGRKCDGKNGSERTRYEVHEMLVAKWKTNMPTRERASERERE